MSTERVTSHVVTFRRSFAIEGYQQALPAGSYVVETVEELLLGISFPAYRRVATNLHISSIPGRPGEKQVWAVDPKALDDAVARDGLQATTEKPADGTRPQGG